MILSYSSLFTFLFFVFLIGVGPRHEIKDNLHAHTQNKPSTNDRKMRAFVITCSLIYYYYYYYFFFWWGGGGGFIINKAKMAATYKQHLKHS